MYHRSGLISHLRPMITVMLVGLLCLASMTFAADKNEEELGDCVICRTPPPPEPTRRKAAESYPPLPLPVVPLRRTEKKRPPAPPVLIAKLQFGKTVVATTDDGRQYRFWDWDSVPGDLGNLLHWANPRLGIRYREETLPLANVSAAIHVPILYMLGNLGFDITDAQAKGLREYLLAGGTLIINPGCGSQPFTRAFETAIKKVFPDKEFFQLEPDHPLFQSFYDVRTVKFRQKVGKPSGQPVVMGINIGCRTAVLFTHYDLACGWVAHPATQCYGLDIEDALRLGTNMIAYALQYHPLGQFLAQPDTELQDTQKGAHYDFVFAQVVHEGDWNPNPKGTTHLIHTLANETNLKIDPQPKSVEIEKADLTSYPFLYMTGHRDFQFSAKEVGKLREYLRNGGFLLANACCGRQSFDQAFRREIGKVLPGAKFVAVPVNSALFHPFYKITQVSFTPDVEAGQPNLEAILVNGNPVVLYSKYDLGNAWEGFPHPFSKGYSPESGMQIGVNAVVYALTH